MGPARVTVVNDNPEFLELIGEILGDERYSTTLIDGDQPNALERIRVSQPDVLVVDLRMGTDELHGWDIAIEFLDELPVLVCSADIQALQSIQGQIQPSWTVRTLAKPFAIEAFLAEIEQLRGS